MIQNEPKTIQDYKDVVKILKLKIIKQNKRIQELEVKNKGIQEQLNSVTIRGDDLQVSSRVMAELENQSTEKREQRELEMATLRGKAEVMSLFVKGVRKIGLTPEAVFRVADFAYKNYVESDYFREVVGKMRLGLSQKEITCLIFIFDESYSGFITRDDYANSLSAYKAAVQNSHHPYIQQCAFKLAQLLHGDKVNLLKFYEEMENRGRPKTGSSKKVIDLALFEQQIKKSYGNRVGQREIMAAFNAIDLQSVGYLQKSNFLYCITSYINKLLSGDEGASRKTQQEWNPNAKSQYHPETLDPAKTTPKRIDKAIENSNQVSKVLPYTPSDSVVQRLQSQYKLSLYTIFQQIMLDPLSCRLTMKSFKRHLLSLNSQLPSNILSDFYREIDAQTKGSIYFSELINFYLANSGDTEMILRLIGKYLYSQDLDSQKFWFMFGLNADVEVSKGKFLQLMSKTFESKNEKLWQNLWLCFDKGRGSCNVGSIIKLFKKYEIQ